MRRTLRAFKTLIIGWMERIRVKNKLYRKGGEIRKPLFIAKSRYCKFGGGVRIKAQVRIECYDSFCGNSLKPNLYFDDGVIIGYRCSFLVADNMYIGKNTIIASDVLITTENHGINPELDIPYHAQSLKVAPVSIGEGCWIGEKVTILPGVKIGKKCIVAAGAVVNRDVPDFSIVAGIPAKIIKKYNFEKHIWMKA